MKETIQDAVNRLKYFMREAEDHKLFPDIVVQESYYWLSFIELRFAEFLGTRKDILSILNNDTCLSCWKVQHLLNRRTWEET